MVTMDVHGLYNDIDHEDGANVCFNALEKHRQKKVSFGTLRTIITHLASKTYSWNSCKWNYARTQIYLQPAKIKSQYFEVR